MKKNIFILLIITFTLFVFSCKSDIDEKSDDNQYVSSDTETSTDADSKNDDDENILPYCWDFSCFSFTDSELEHISFLKEIIPSDIKKKFNELYLNWMEVWFIQDPDDPRFILDAHVSSTPQSRSLLPEYKVLLEYCKKYNKAILPLIIDIYTPTEPTNPMISFSINLLSDLTCNGDLSGFFNSLWSVYIWDYWNEVGQGEVAKSYYNLYPAQVCYCKQLLENEGDNILQAIQDLREAENVSEE